MNRGRQASPTRGLKNIFGQHLAFEVSAVHYPGWKSKLAEADIEITHEQDWGNGVMSFYFNDPSGHLLEICQPGVWG